MKRIILTALIIILMSGVCYADIGGELGARYLSTREQIEWTVGVNYTFDKGFIGLGVHTYTGMPLNSDTPPYIGFAPQSVLWTFEGEYEIFENVSVTSERFCEHWAVQSGEYNDYVGYSAGIKYEF